MDNSNEHRIPLRNTALYKNRKRSIKRASKTEKSSFIVRLNICITMVAALVLMSKINSETAKNITSKIKYAITQNITLSEFKEKAAEVFNNFSWSDTSDEVFSELSPDITNEINKNKELEDNLKNK